MSICVCMYLLQWYKVVVACLVYFLVELDVN